MSSEVAVASEVFCFFFFLSLLSPTASGAALSAAGEFWDLAISSATGSCLRFLALVLANPGSGGTSAVFVSPRL